MNQQALRLTIKMVEERKGKLSVLRSQGQSRGMTRRGGGRGKSDDWSTGSLRQKGHHVREI